MRTRYHYWLASAGMLLALTIAGNGQQTSPAPTNPTTPPAQSDTRKGGLGLTDDQKAQIKSIRQDAKTQAAAIKNNSSLSKEQKKEQLKALHESTREKVEGVMTPEQRAKFEARKKQHKRHRRHHRRHRDDGAATPGTAPAPNNQ